MDDAFDLADYLPVSFKTPSEQEYISFLWSVFEENYDRAKYQFAFLAYHMLVMSFVYFNIWQIRKSLPGDFTKGVIGFDSKDENSLLNDDSPFTFSKVSESRIFQILRLIGCDASKIGNYKKLVNDRNDAAHANGNVFFSAQHKVAEQIRKAFRAVEEIQTHSQPIIQRCYENFLLDGYNPEEREYSLV